MVSEAFLHFFVRTVGHYSSYVKRDRNGGAAVFEKRSFYKAIDSKTTRHFVKKFIQTQMFDLFIQEVEQQQLGPQQGGGGARLTLAESLKFLCTLLSKCLFLQKKTSDPKKLRDYCKIYPGNCTCGHQVVPDSFGTHWQTCRP